MAAGENLLRGNDAGCRRLIIIAVADNPAVLVLGVALLGIAEGPQLTAIFGIRQRDAPAQLRGQIFTTAASLKLTAGALGSVAGGILLEHSVSATLLVAAATQLLALLVSQRPSSAS